MTYRTFIGDDGSSAKYEHDGAPQSFMMLDIAALQEMYGADYTTNSGNTVYKWNPNQGITYVDGVAAITPAANRIFATIWDGGGIDTYDLSAYTTGLKIDLRAGGHSVFSQGQLADLGGGPNNGYARGNIFNALLYQGNVASLIENVQAGSGNDSIVGNEADNTLWGNAGNDSLSGGSGNDTLIGGTGNDTYIVDDLADVVTEGLNEGTDLIRTVLSSYALTINANVENLTFTGTGAFTGTGSGLANTITGGAGNDTLDGGAGNDTLIGGAGNDIYVVDAGVDFVVESANKGTDTVRTALSSYILSNNVENLSYTGSASFTGTGNALANTITGGAGNDVLDGAAGADTMIGGAGDDTYVVDNAGDSVAENAGAGTDTVRTILASYTLGANVENLTYIGTAAFVGTGNSLANTITGGVGNDTLNGAAGADTLIGGAGNDIYVVDTASDVVTELASAGSDEIRTSLATYSIAALINVENLSYTGSASFTGTGNALANRITGGAGNDLLDGGTGNDTLIGGAGNDIYVVDTASDVVTELASAGTDEIRTSLAAYSIATLINVENLSYTGSANFTGTGNALANRITGGAGHDTLNGGAGADIMIGGAGDDTYIVDNAGDSVAENAAAGTDTVRTILAAYTLGANVENLTYIGTAAFVGTGNSLANIITGGVGNDTLNGGAGADSLIGGAGDDTYIVDNAGDSVAENAATGTDTVKTVLANYTIGNNVENLTYTGSANFTGTGNALANTITGGAGNDLLDGGAGNDALIGGAGNDIYVVDSAGDVVTELASAGTDEIRTSLAAYSIGALINVENLTYAGSANFTGTGNALANTITGGAGHDTLNGGAGADSLIGGAGDDTYIVDNAGDSVAENAAAGTDTVKTVLASYTLDVNVENLIYIGIGTAAFAGTGNDLDNVITGAAAADTLSGGDGNDTLNGGAGADSLIGGAGDDTYIVDNAGDSVAENADEGTDTVKTVLASYTLGVNVENLTYAGTAAFVGTGNSLANTITGGVGNDTLNGGAGADSLIGGAGNDIYIVDDLADVITEAASVGTDEIRTSLATYSIAALTNVENLSYTESANFTGTGNALANRITGGAGNDLLDGGAGNDTLIGGAGNDIYVVDSASDVVTELASASTDEIRTALAAYSIATLINVENLSYTGSANFTGTGNALANIITGGAGNDTLNGGAGADSLIGGAGDDTYIVDNAGDGVAENAAAGTDTVKTVLASYTLGSDVENLTYIGTVAFAGTGNDLDNVITGAAAIDTLSGGDGNDTLNGGAGADSLIGGAGDDTYIVDNVGDSVAENAAAGTDTVKTVLANYMLGVNVENLIYIGTAAFVGTGNSLANTITGGVGNDTLNGGAGADSLIGGAGHDIYIVDDLADVVTEGLNEGTDLIRTVLSSYALTNIANVENLAFIGTGDFIGTGNVLANTIIGGAGNDLLDGGTGNDTLVGGAGNDIYVVDTASDIVTELANAGTDEIRTSLAAYSIAALINVENLTYTGSANFTGIGNALANTITGGAGHDTLNGGAGADTMIGGAGDDTYIVDNAGDSVAENAAAGTDTVRTTLASYTLGSDLENLTYIGTAAFAGTGNALNNVLIGGAAADNLSGGAGNDTLLGGAGSDMMSGGTGDDIYVVDIATDLVIENTNEGTDTVQTALASYTIGNNVENLTYTGSANFTGTGNALANTITGGAGNDVLDGGAGADTLIGGAGNDTYIVDNAVDIVVENVDAGTDTVRTTLASYTLGSDVENLTYIGTTNFAGTGNDLDNVITGAAAADTLSGGDGNDTLNGGAGADSLIGGAGDDTYIVDNAGDSVAENADEGTDTVKTVLANYTLGVNVENLTYIGTVAFAGTGNALNNVLAGGAGVDTLNGGTGDDTYVISTGDIVTENADEGIDMVQTNSTAYTLGVNVENLTYGGTAAFTGTGNALDNIIKGGVVADKLTGAGGNDTLIGGAGSDTMSGGAGNDIYVVDIATDLVIENANEGTDTVQTALASYTIGNNVENLTYAGSANFTGTGNALANTITGGAGHDTLNGGAGADSLIGGAGDDTYIVDNAGDSVAENAAAGTDTVKTVLASYTLDANVENLTYIGIGTAAFAGTGNDLDNVITGAAAADTLSGGDGNDTLNGGAGADSLIGGAGDDTYIVDNAGDSVAENADEGTDTVKTVLASYTLGVNVENLTYAGTAAFVGTGNSLANTITGGVGNDTLNGGAGADSLIGGAGNDIYIVDDLADVITEAASVGTDEIRTSLATYSIAALTNVENLSYTESANFTGTGNALANRITGGAGNDLLDGGAGNDTLIGGAGNDIYVVDSASDVVTELASASTDEIRTALAAYSIATLINVENLSYTGSANFTGTGNALANIITGGAGNDTLNGGAGADSLIGGAGDDTYIVDNAGDGVAENAAAGTDTVKTVLASYTLGSDVENLTYIGTVAFAGTGNDLDNVITGAAAIDTLSGGDGNDTLNGGAGADSLIGGAGDDTYIVDNVGDSVAENAAAGTDTVKTVLANYMLGVNVENLIYIGTAAFVGTGNSLANTITGGVGNDTLNGGAGADSLIGGAGHDIYIVDDLADVVTEGLNEGTDLIRTVLSSYALTNIANVENLAFIGTGDFIGTGNVLANTIIGGAGNDLLDGGTGNDTLVGGAGNDIYVVDTASDIVTELANAGTDEIRTSLAAYSIAALINVENLTYTGSANFTGIGNALANTITGGAGHDTLNGGAGADTMIGGAGDDTYIVDNAGDSVAENAAAGTDTVRTTLASYTLGSDLENLTYIGTAAFAGTGNALNNVLIGGAAADNLSGGAGNDTLLGGAGSDMMSGGTGDDIYVVDIATDLVIENTNEGTDTVQTALASYTIGNNVENLTYTGSANFTGTGNALANTITGGAGNDVLDGGAGADTLIGGAGNDTYIVDNAVDIVVENVDAGTDTVRTTLASYTLGSDVENLTYIGTTNFAGTGNSLDNLIVGGSGADIIAGGAGNDILVGGDAADLFVYLPNWGHDTIIDFLATGTAHDTIRIDHNIFADWESLFAASSQYGNDTVVTADIDNTIVLRNVALTSLDSGDFLFA
ncbi:M10 family metallopeptidase C-terminal domain-containing protein [Rhizobium laguerreae]|uniref:M10 family metallopeptidase C-terminal domain-containing protein n=3 Tax=Rhizobium laguerreae TaxID=1076926 RepID=UPI003AB964B3